MNNYYAISLTKEFVFSGNMHHECLRVNFFAEEENIHKNVLIWCKMAKKAGINRKVALKSKWKSWM